MFFFPPRVKTSLSCHENKPTHRAGFFLAPFLNLDSTNVWRRGGRGENVTQACSLSKVTGVLLPPLSPLGRLGSLIPFDPRLDSQVSFAPQILFPPADEITESAREGKEGERRGGRRKRRVGGRGNATLWFDAREFA